jgi:hypothetical protein
MEIRWTPKSKVLKEAGYDVDNLRGLE